MYTLEDVYKTFPSGCTEDYKILRAFEMGKQTLEKENKRLTDELKSLRESIKDYGAGCYENGLRNGKRKLEEQLTKAKEIIKELMSFSVQLCDCRHTVDFEKTREQAEQFLNGDGCPDCLCEDCTKDCPIEKIKEIEK